MKDEYAAKFGTIEAMHGEVMADEVYLKQQAQDTSLHTICLIAYAMHSIL